MPSLLDLIGPEHWRYLKALTLSFSALMLLALNRAFLLCTNQTIFDEFGNGTPLSPITALFKIPIGTLIGIEKEILFSLNAKTALMLLAILIISFVVNTWPRAIFCKLVERQRTIFEDHNSKTLEISQGNTIKNYIKHSDFGTERLQYIYYLTWSYSQIALTIFFCLMLYTYISPPIITTIERLSVYILLPTSMISLICGEYIFHAKIFPRYIALMRISGESLN